MVEERRDSFLRFLNESNFESESSSAIMRELPPKTKQITYEEAQKKTKISKEENKVKFGNIMHFVKCCSLILFFVLILNLFLVIYYVATKQFLGYPTENISYNLSWIIPSTMITLVSGFFGFVIAKFFED